MKLAIASEGQTSESIAVTNAGRAPYYLIFEDKKLIETLKNPFLEDAGIIIQEVEDKKITELLK